MTNKSYFLPLPFLLSVIVMGSCGNRTGQTSDQINPVQTPSTLPSSPPLRTSETSKYEPKNRGVFGLYYVASKDMADERKLIISEDDQPIPPKANDPDEATIPGFYLSHEHRLDFKEVEVSGERVYFKTLEVEGVTYEFRGTTGEEIDPNFSDDVPIPFIKGSLKMIKEGRVVRTESIRFGHAVIA